jgi:hypothetical protein
MQAETRNCRLAPVFFLKKNRASTLTGDATRTWVAESCSTYSYCTPISAMQSGVEQPSVWYPLTSSGYGSPKKKIWPLSSAACQLMMPRQALRRHQALADVKSACVGRCLSPYGRAGPARTAPTLVAQKKTPHVGRARRSHVAHGHGAASGTEPKRGGVVREDTQNELSSWQFGTALAWRRISGRRSMQEIRHGTHAPANPPKKTHGCEFGGLHATTTHAAACRLDLDRRLMIGCPRWAPLQQACSRSLVLTPTADGGLLSWSISRRIQSLRPSVRRSTAVVVARND